MTAPWLLDTATAVLALGAAVATPLGWRFRPVATFAVICVAGVVALVEMPAVISVAAGGLAAVYLLAVHSLAVPGVNALTAPMFGSVLTGCAIALLASLMPVTWAWWPLLGPIAVLVVYAAAISPMVSPESKPH